MSAKVFESMIGMDSTPFGGMDRLGNSDTTETAFFTLDGVRHTDIRLGTTRIRGDFSGGIS